MQNDEGLTLDKFHDIWRYNYPNKQCTANNIMIVYLEHGLVAAVVADGQHEVCLLPQGAHRAEAMLQEQTWSLKEGETAEQERMRKDCEEEKCD